MLGTVALMHHEPGLRERKKAATRSALCEAAIELSLQEGFDAVTAEQIAARAGVSTRTFHNYFSSKEAAVMYQKRTAIFSFADFVRQHRPDEPILNVLRDGIIEQINHQDISADQLRAREQMIRESPALTTYGVSELTEISLTVINEIAEFTGTDPEKDLYPKILCAAVIAAVHAAFDQWYHNPEGMKFTDVIAEAFAHIEVSEQPVKGNPRSPQ